MSSSWHRSEIVVVGRVAVALMLIAGLLLPAPQAVDREIHAIGLIHLPTGESSTEIRDHLVSEIGSETFLTIGPVVTDISEAIQDALWAIEPAKRGAIIVASDGQWDPELLTTLRRARTALIPIFWLPLAPYDVAPVVANVKAPNRARAGQLIRVTVEIRLAGTGPVEVVLLANNRPVAQIGARQSGVINFQIDVPESGPLILGAEIRDINIGEVVARISQGALVNVDLPPSILVVSSHPSLFGDSLRKGNWQVTELSPRELSGQIDNLHTYSCLVLDDVAVSDLPDAVWSEVANAVRRDATGLLVLGGPHAFGLGAYRDSQLESLLPVISEPPDDEAPASLVFLIDVSGSMDRMSATDRRLQMAKQAVIESVRALRPVDRVGLMTFDVEPRELLSPDSRPDHAKSIEQAWPERASGGTQLMPALRRAIDTLGQIDNKQKLLVLLTDGFLAGADLDELEDILPNSDVELIAMIVGDGGQSEIDRISRIAHASGGRMIQIDDVLRLPTLMRSEIESRRPAVVTGQSRPIVSSPSVWMPGDVTWPPVDAYLLTRARNEAQVHLATERGDVLVASMNAGAGKVVVFTSGLSSWTSRWLQWDQWPDIAAGLTNFIAAGSASDIDITLQKKKINEAQLNIELSQRTLPDRMPGTTLISPSGVSNSIDLEPQSPGRLGAGLQLDSYGQYSLVVNDGSTTTRYRFLNNRNYANPTDDPPIAKTWLDDGIVQLWQPELLSEYQDKFSWRSLLNGLALLTFFLLLVFERKDLIHKILTVRMKLDLGR